jgi:transposase
VRVSAAGSGRISIAALLCTRPGDRPRLIWRTRIHRGRKGETKGFREKDYAHLLDDAHQQLGGPIALVWTTTGTHPSAAMKQLIATRAWLRVYQLPAYAPELNPVEAVWAHMQHSLANLAKHTLDQLTVLVKRRLKHIQYRTGLLDGFLAKPAWTSNRRNPND